MQRLFLAILLALLPSCHSKLFIDAYYNTDIDAEECFCPSIELQVLEQLKKDRASGLVTSPYAGYPERSVTDEIFGFGDDDSDRLQDQSKTDQNQTNPTQEPPSESAEAAANAVEKSATVTAAEQKNQQVPANQAKANAPKSPQEQNSNLKADLEVARSVFNREKRIINRAMAIENTHADVAREIIIWSTQLKYQRHLYYQDGCIVASDHGYILRLKYISQDALELEEARELIVDATEGLIEHLSKTSFPVTIDNLEIVIDFQSYQGLYVDPYYVGYIWLENGITHIFAFDTKDRDLDFWDSRVEAYANTKNFVQYHREAEKIFEEHYKIPKKKYLMEDRLQLQQ
jgi:hypothetical protein